MPSPPLPETNRDAELSRSSTLRPLFDSRQLLVFGLLAQTGSFTKTARDLGVSQSAVSHSIRILERSVGCRLFERTSRRVQLTFAGEQLFHHVLRINREIAGAHDSIQMLRTWGQTQVRIAAPASICEVLLPSCLREIRERHPNSLISIAAADRVEAVAELAAGRVDIAVVVGEEPDARFDLVPLFEDELSFVLRPDHPWCRQPPPSPSAIGSEPLLTYRPQSFTGRLIQDYFAAAGISPTVVIGCDSLAALREMVQMGMGVGILAQWMVAHQVANGHLRQLPLGERRLQRTWGVLTLATRRLALPHALLIDQLRKVGLQMMTEATLPLAVAADPQPAPQEVPNDGLRISGVEPVPSSPRL